MRHLTICDYGCFIGVTSNRLVVKSKDGTYIETPLSRLRSICIEKQGISVSSDLVYACAARGIRIFFLDWRNIAVAALSALNQHGVVAVRIAQLRCINSVFACDIAIQIIYCKLRNQRAVLLYFSKYLNKTKPEISAILQDASKQLASISKKIISIESDGKIEWRETLLGYEGVGASIYWNAIRQSGLFPRSFEKREGRGAIEITNAALNYGYTILESYVWSALDNAGLELYAGIFHKDVVGRASLVLDVMEEYRAWVVDRNIIKLRSQLEEKSLTPVIKKKIIDSIDNTMITKIKWHSKNVKLENVMQRSVYRLVNSFVEGKPYRGIKFKW